MISPRRRIALLAALALGAPLGAITIGAISATPAVAAAPVVVNTTLAGTNDDGQCGLEEAVVAANTDADNAGCTATAGADTINFSFGSFPQTFTIGATLNVLNGDLTIDGPTTNPGDIVIDGSSSKRLIMVPDALNILVSDLTLRSGAAGVGNGGAIAGGLAVGTNNVVFSGNTAATGGAIATDAATTTITNSDFSTNSATVDDGGAIAAVGNVVVNGDSDFVDNTAPHNGAGIRANGNVTVTGPSNFTNNDQGDGLGGAIKGQTVNITGGADFDNNNSTSLTAGNGACIGAAGAVTVTAGGDGSTFTSNTTFQGGGCIITSSTVDITGATFIGNKSTGNRGGAISVSAGTSTITDSTFGGPTVGDGNTGDVGGGAISTIANGSNIQITNSEFSHNSSPNAGGAVLAVTPGGTSSVTITNSTFDQNTAANGGAVRIGSTAGIETLTVSGSTFSGNTVTSNGGAIDLITGAEGSVTNSTFDGNGHTGGGASVGTTIAMETNGGSLLSLDSVTVNNSSGPGGALHQVTGQMSLRATIVANTTGDGTSKNCVGIIQHAPGNDFNLESAGPESTGSTCPTGDTNLLDADPLLGPLQVNAAGTTATDLPALASPAVDAIPTPCTTPATDQRGIARPQGLACDVGAAELEDGRYTPVVPARILNTKANPFVGFSGPLGSGQSKDLTVLGVGGIPSDPDEVSAVVMNVAVTQPSTTSYLTVWPTGAPKPTASNLNFTAGKVIANLVVVKVGTAGQVSFFNGVGTVHVVADVVGYYGWSGSSRLTSIVPSRILNSKVNLGFTGPLGSGQTKNLTVTGVGGVPASGVTAVVINVAATQPSTSSYLTVWPAGAPKPTASNLNFTAGQTIPNLVMVGVGTGGQISIFNGAGTVQVVGDVVGYYSADGESHLVPLVPFRVLNSKANPFVGFQGPLGSAQTKDLTLVPHAGAGIPATGVAGVVMNTTATQPSTTSYLTVWPTGATRPTASNLNFTAGLTIPNLVVVKIGTGGKISIFNGVGTVQVVGDVVGYYASP